MRTSGVLSTAPLVQPETGPRTSSNESPAGVIDNGAAGSVAAAPGIDASLALYPPSFIPLTFEADPVPAATPAGEDAGPPANRDGSAADPVDRQPPAVTPPPAPGWDAPESRGDWVGGEREEESQDDDSTDGEEDYPFWVNLKEDTSSPDEEELRAIEETMDEVSALDRK